eukprot:365247-Chlamydomonas_euryale.AAC.22
MRQSQDARPAAVLSSRAGSLDGRYARSRPAASSAQCCLHAVQWRAAMQGGHKGLFLGCRTHMLGPRSRIADVHAHSELM